MAGALLLGPALGCLSAAALLAFIIIITTQLLARRRVQDGRGRAVLVTGCDSGFGQQLALRLDREGFVVFAGCLCPEGPGARSLAQQSSSSLKLLRLDVTSDADVEQVKAAVLQHLPEKGLWAVVNNAGISQWAEIEWSSVQDFSHMVDVNLLGAVRTTLAFLPLVRASRGRVVYTSSIFSFFTCLNMAAYSVSKRGLEAFADCLRVEMASFGVKVSIIQPGNFGRATGILKTMTGSDIWEKLDKEKQQVFNRRYLLVAAGERPFFQLLPFLPTFLTDRIFSFSHMYAKRKEMLYS
ncbi:unnamed protein product [Tetraodon nigroviridis]|uniref:(spotted green pufferfish) hypothetical protein n=1 Tax=Tetraodon nigroviridis TaxID=99883 RepID=Q4SDE0_TETNG|nr:unnamed protein product [Tetraodon nigroviridis]